jgi:hypothetical protein
MDDVLVLAPTRWKLRHAVRVLNETLAALGLEKHPDKTFIGRTEKGFDFLGYRCSARKASGWLGRRGSDSQYAGPGFKSESAPEGVLPVRLGCTCGVGGAGPRLVLAAWKRPA